MDRKEKRIINIIEKNTGILVKKIDLDIDLFEYGYMDSFDFLNIISNVNEELMLNISPGDYEINEINTIRKIITIIMRR